MEMDARQKLVSLLRSIGLNQYEAQAYTSLLLLGDATAGELSNRAEIPRPRVYDIITRLEKKGFVIVQPGRPIKYKAVPPKDAIRTYMKMKEEEYKKEFERMEKIGEELERVSSYRSTKDEEGGFWVLNTDNILRTSIQNLITSSSNEVLVSFTPEFMAEYGNTILPLLEDAASRGVHVKVLVPRGLASNLVLGGDVTVMESEADLPPTVMVDNKAALIAIPRGKKAILVDHPDFSRTFKQLVENNVDLI